MEHATRKRNIKETHTNRDHKPRNVRITKTHTNATTKTHNTCKQHHEPPDRNRNTHTFKPEQELQTHNGIIAHQELQGTHNKKTKETVNQTLTNTKTRQQ